MTLKEILNILKKAKYHNLAGKIKKTIERDPIDFTLEDISCLIYEEYELKADKSLLILEKDIQKNGILLY